MTDLVKNYIGGKWVEAQGGSTFDTSDPATLDVIAPVARSAADDVNAAVAAAKAAYPGWRNTPAPRRGEILFKLAHILAERKEELSRLMTREMGKTLTETRGDVQEAIDMAYYMGGEGRRLKGYTSPSKCRISSACPRDSVGVVGLITPWNFPVAVPSWKILPALIAGNTIVWKPSEDTPASSARSSVLIEAGLPSGVINLVVGHGDAGAALTTHPDVRILSFTGSTTTGLAVYSKAAALGKKVTLEMGGKNAIIVLDDANLDLAVEAITWSAYGTTGQRCTATSRLIVQKGIRAKLTEALLEKARTLKVGNGLEDGVQVGPLVNQKALDKVAGYMDVAKADGATLLFGGGRATDAGPGYFFQPTLFADVTPDIVSRRRNLWAVPFDDRIVSRKAAKLTQHAYGLSSAPLPRTSSGFRSIRDLRRDCLHQSRHDRRGNPVPVWRHARHRQRYARGRAGGAGQLYRVEICLRRFQRAFAARAN